MAPGCEPLAVGRMMDALRPYVHGQCLAGAGGGGFLYVLTKAPRQKEALHQILANTEVSCEPPTAASGLQHSYIEHEEHLSPSHMECDCLLFQCPPWDLGGEKGSFAGSCPNLGLSFSRDWATSASTASKWTQEVSLWRLWDVI